MDDRPSRTDGTPPSSPKGPELDRLPPPAFPPGARRAWVPRATRERTAGGGLPAGALISPDEPIRRIGDDFPEGAFISPDEPIVQGGGGEADTPDEGEYDADDENVEVTGIGSGGPDRYRADPAGYRGPRDPEEVAGIMEGLAAALRTQGSAALATSPELSPFESALRGFLGGYLVGRG